VKKLRIANIRVHKPLIFKEDLLRFSELSDFFTASEGSSLPTTLVPAQSNPKGIAPSSPGLSRLAGATLGKYTRMGINSEGVAPFT
jgi:hypothetical protein